MTPRAVQNVEHAGVSAAGLSTADDAVAVAINEQTAAAQHHMLSIHHPVARWFPFVRPALTTHCRCRTNHQNRLGHMKR